jgi:RNA polymerase sigma factor (sigma-70 family)
VCVKTDIELAEAWKAGDASAGDALFERHFDALFRFFRNKVGEGMEDLVHDTFVACVSGPQFRGEASFRTWLFTVARHTLYAHLKKHARRGEELDANEVSIASLATSPSGLLAKKSEERLLLQALRAIPLDLQVALELFYWEDLAAPEIAAVLEVPEGTVRSRLRRAKEVLDERLAELAETPSLLESTRTGLETWAKGVRAQLE